MAATIVTREPLESGLESDDVQALIELRLKAGAIRSWPEDGFLCTEWNVIGEQ